MRWIKLALLLTPLLLALPAWGAQNTLTWTDNSVNEQNFNIERTTAATVAACATATGFIPLTSVGLNITSFVDATVTEGGIYCYRVNASNVDATSSYSNIAGRRVPFGIPVAPSALGVGP